MEKIVQAIIEAISKALADVASAKVLATVGAFATFTAMKQYNEAALVVVTFLGIGGAREVVKTITAGKTDTAVAEATAAVAAAPPPAAAAATTVAATLTPAASATTPVAPADAEDDPAGAEGLPDTTRDDIVPEAPDAPEPLEEPEPADGF